MKPLISKQAIQYLYNDFVAESLKQTLPVQKELTSNQLNLIYNLTLRSTNSVFGFKKYGLRLEQVAFIIFNLNKQHILEDGNKRFSLILGIYLLDSAGIDYQKISRSDWEMLIMRIASDTIYSIKDTISYLKEKLN